MAALAERYGLPRRRHHAALGAPSPARGGSARADRGPRSAEGRRRPPGGLAGWARVRADPRGREARRPRIWRRPPGSAAGDRAARDERRARRERRAEKRVSRAGRGGVRMQRTLSSSTPAPRLGPRASRLSMSSPPARWRRSRSSSNTRRRCWSSAARSSLGEAGAIRATRTRRAARRPSWVSSRWKFAICSHFPAPKTGISTSCRRLRRHLQGFRVVPEWRSSAHSGPHRTQRTHPGSDRRHR